MINFFDLLAYFAGNIRTVGVTVTFKCRSVGLYRMYIYGISFKFLHGLLSEYSLKYKAVCQVEHRCNEREFFFSKTIKDFKNLSFPDELGLY